MHGVLSVNHPLKSGLWTACRPSRPEDLALLAEVREQVQEQEARAQAAEVALYSLRKDVSQSSIYLLASVQCLLSCRHRGSLVVNEPLPSAHYHGLQVLLNNDAEHGGIKAAGRAEARGLQQSLAAQSGVMAWMRGPAAATGSKATARGRAGTIKAAARKPPS
jgi:hypothetical protein